MKKRITLSLLLCSFVFFAHAQTAGLTEQLTAILKKEVKVDKDVIRQNITWAPDAPWKMNITVEKNNGKKTVNERYQFNLADFNPYLITRQSKDSYQGVSCRTEKSNNYIEYWEDGKQSGYVNNFLLYFNDVNDADAFAQKLKEAIPLAQDLWNKSIQLPDGLPALQDFLAKRVVNIDIDGATIKQRLTPDTKITDRVSLEVEEGGKSKAVTSRYDFSWGDLNALDISFKTSGNKVFVNFETRRNIRYVQTFENGEPDGFDNGFRILVKSPDDAKIIVKAAEKLIPEGEKAIQARLPKVTSFATAIAALNGELKIFTTKNEKVEQAFSEQCIATFKVKNMPVKEGESTESAFLFNWADMNATSVDYKISGNSVTVRIATMSKQNLIAENEKGTLKRYNNDLDLQFGDVESGRRAQHIITQLIPLCPQTNATAQTGDWMVTALSDMPTLKSEVVVALKRKETGKDCSWTLSITNVSDKKGGSEEIWEFDLNRMDSAETKFEVSGKDISLKVPAKYNEKIIKYYKDGKQSFVNKVTIPVDTIEKAKTMAQTMKVLIDGCR